MAETPRKFMDRILAAVDAVGEWQENKVLAAWRPLKTLAPVVATAVVAGFAGAGAVATGIAAAALTGGMTVAVIGVVALGTVSAMTIVGAAVMTRTQISEGKKNQASAGNGAAFILLSAFMGAGLTGFLAGGGLQSSTGNYSMPVNPELRRAFNMGQDADRIKQISKDIMDYAEKKIASEVAHNSKVCAANKEFFALKGIRCDVYNVPQQVPQLKNSPVP